MAVEEYKEVPMAFLTRTRSRYSRMVMVLVFAGVLLFSFVGLAHELVVTSTADNGAGTLRWALRTARPGDVITFDPAVFPPDDPATIYVRTGLPALQCGKLTIDASDAGVILDGTEASGSCRVGLEIQSDHNVIRGLQIVNFKNGVGLILSGSAQHNTIGGDRTAGAGPIGQGNLLSGNDTGIGAWGAGVSHNVITGNLIGTDSSRQNPHESNGNIDGIGIREGASKNTVGPDNIIAFNEAHGVVVNGDGTRGNTITRNSP